MKRPMLVWIASFGVSLWLGVPASPSAQAQDSAGQVTMGDVAFSPPLSSASFEIVGDGQPLLVERDCAPNGSAYGPRRSPQSNSAEIGLRTPVPRQAGEAGTQLYTRYNCINPGARP